MNRLVLFFGIIISITVITWTLKAQQRPPEKKYPVALTLNNWVQITQELEYIKSQLRQSDLPSKQVAYISDSLLSTLQSTIGLQVNALLEAEKPKPEVKKDSTNHKRN